MRRFTQLLKGALHDERGAMMTEYTVVTGFVAMLALPALLYCGVALAANFAHVRDYVLYPFPGRLKTWKTGKEKWSQSTCHSLA